MNRKILLISPQPFFQWRGSPIRVRFVLKSLSESGHAVDLLTLPFGEDEQITNVRIIRAPNLFRARRIAIGPSPLKLGFDLVLFCKAASLLRRHRYDLIHGIEEAGFIALLLARLFKTKSVFEKHSDPFSYRRGMLKNFLLSCYAAVESFVIRRADLVICTGAGLTRQAQAVGTDKPVHTIYDMASSMTEASPARTAAVGARLRQRPDELLITYVGSFAVYQGVEMLFEAMPTVCAALPQARFVIIGGSAEEIARRRAWLAERGAAEHVAFLGRVAPDELPDYLAASDILAAPRQSGVNTPLKVLDYYKAGRAIVAADVPSNQLILNETTALFAQPDPASFAAQLIRLAGDSALRQRLGANGRLLYEQKYNFAAFQRRLERAYAELDRQD